MEQAQMPRYFSPHDICFRVTAPRTSKRWGEIGKRVAVLDSGRYSLVFADKTRRAFGPTSVKEVAMPSAPPAPRAMARRGGGRRGAGRGESPRGSRPPVLLASRGPRLMAVRYGHELRRPAGDAAVAPVAERPPDPDVANDETSDDDRPLTAEEQYERTLENLALAFSEFLYWALQTRRTTSPAAARTLGNIARQLSDYERDLRSDGDGADSSEEEFNNYS